MASSSRWTKRSFQIEVSNRFEIFDLVRYFNYRSECYVYCSCVDGYPPYLKFRNGSFRVASEIPDGVTLASINAEGRLQKVFCGQTDWPMRELDLSPEIDDYYRTLFVFFSTNLEDPVCLKFDISVEIFGLGPDILDMSSIRGETPDYSFSQTDSLSELVDTCEIRLNEFLVRPSFKRFGRLIDLVDEFQVGMDVHLCRYLNTVVDLIDRVGNISLLQVYQLSFIVAHSSGERLRLLAEVGNRIVKRRRSRVAAVN